MSSCMSDMVENHNKCFQMTRSFKLTSVYVSLNHFRYIMVKVSNDQEMAQSESNSYSKNQVGNKTKLKNRF